jgi:hypothetical protein
MLALAAAGCGSSSGRSADAHDGTTSASAATMPPVAASTAASRSGGGSGPEGIPLEHGPQLAPASSTSPGTTVDGIHCAPLEQLAYHIHAHLQVYVDGQPRTLPAAIGMLGPVAEQTPYGPFYGATQCYYWLHTHASDGVIHIESPTKRIYTLGNFFDEWRQPLSSTRVASAAGRVTAFVDGKRWTAAPGSIPLRPHAVIQLDVGSPIVPFHNVSFAGTGL